MSDYLPPWATLDEAARWLEARTSEKWPPERIVRSGARLAVWLDPPADDPVMLREVFGGRPEGYLAPINFGGDTQRLGLVRAAGTLTITQTADGKMVRFSPPVPYRADEVRVMGEDVRELAGGIPPALPERQPIMASNRERVLAALRAAGFDPADLPPFTKGLDCPAKTAARDGAKLSKAAFDHAWKELSAEGAIIRRP
jgi:hypothetical protein